MHIDTPCALMPLHRFVPQRLHVPQGASVQVLRGAAWLTYDHSSREQVLQAGERATLRPGQRVFLTALGGEACVKVSERPAGRASAWAAWRQRLAAPWSRRLLRPWFHAQL